MKSIAKTALLILSVWLCCTAAYAECPCEKILEDGLRRELAIARTSTFASDFRSYLLTGTFEMDLKSGAWGGSLTVPVEGVPVTIGANASSSDLSTFRQKVQQEQSLTIKSSDYQTLASSIPDSEIAQIYSDCISKNCSDRSGFLVEPQVGDDFALFTITYRKAFDADPMPVVKSFSVINATVNSQPPAVDSSIQGSTLISLTRSVSE